MNPLDFIILMSLVITIIVEFFVYWLAFRHHLFKLFGYSVLVNCLTVPVVFILNNFIGFYFSEILVFIAEGFLIVYLLKTSYKKAFIVSFIANLATAFIGVVVNFFPF
ncbi:hypothetical protein KY317_01790 [Candidatus Woesearchaeota archaeon]|nr:hypothetical protein [Candidatus Woesearchaeota archaeon]